MMFPSPCGDELILEAILPPLLSVLFPSPCGDELIPCGDIGIRRDFGFRPLAGMS